MENKFEKITEKTILKRICRLFGVLCVFSLSVPALFAGINEQEKEMISQGTWEVEQVTVDKNTDGRTARRAYRAASEVQSYIISPKSWEIKDSETIVQRYPDGTEETSKYTIEDNQLYIYAATALQSYQFSINKETLTLSCTHYYWNNLPTGRTEKIEEKWTIVLTKK